jgi:hypothetical protein
MAYKQKPGNCSGMKTGGGLPSGLFMTREMSADVTSSSPTTGGVKSSTGIVKSTPVKGKSPMRQQTPKTNKAVVDARNKTVNGKFTNTELTSADNLIKRKPGTGLVSGTTYSERTNQVETKPYEKKIVENKSGVFVVDGYGKTVKSVKKDKFKPEAEKNLRREFTKDSSATMDARNANRVIQNAKTSYIGGF